MRKGTADSMQEMIKRIIEMDRKAQEITEAAEHEKIDSEKDIAKKAAQLREDYLSRARHRIKVNREMESVIQQQQWEKRKAQYDIQIEKMKMLYDTSGDKWVEAIFQRVIAE